MYSQNTSFQCLFIPTSFPEFVSFAGAVIIFDISADQFILSAAGIELNFF
jgi:hypothetical protein